MAKEEFSPKVYNFTLSQEFADSAVCWDLNSYKVESPSFNILFDHTIAVIWHVFNKDGAELYCLNRADISWALRFLEAIDTSRIFDTTDLDALIDYFRKIVVSRYALEEENSIEDENKTLYNSISPENASSLALDEFLNSAVVKEEMDREMKKPKPTPVPTCTEAEILEHLKKLNPLITSMSDVKNCLEACGKP